MATSRCVNGRAAIAADYGSPTARSEPDCRSRGSERCSPQHLSQPAGLTHACRSGIPLMVVSCLRPSAEKGQETSFGGR
jgi:hypothetical protein